MIETLTWFDGIALAVIVLSALMALSRGFMRELATLGAFIAALAAAFFGHALLRDHVSSILPESMSSWVADVVVVGLAFIIVYVIVRVLGSRFTSLVQGSEGVSMVDRLAGLIFGAARGGAALVFTAWLMINVVPADRVPSFISGSASYPAFERAAAALNANAPRIAEDIQEALPDTNL